MADEQQKENRVRPELHLTANCWINDPCAPGFDACTQTYHLFYQTNPSSTEWGHMSWGHVESKDMLVWTSASREPALRPDQDYDREGVFTGSWLPADRGELQVVYSSVRRLPFHWSTPPYPANAAGLAMATSSDGGKTWSKASMNPILHGEPEYLQVSGFRDPFVSTWACMDQALGNDQDPRLYGIVSGGIVGDGPTTFLYRISDDPAARWVYLWPLVTVPLRFSFSSKWSGNFGVNWECVNFMTLRSDDEKRQFLVIGAEGDIEKDHVRQHPRSRKIAPRTVRSQLWMMGTLERKNHIVQMHHKYGGYLDHGPYYAANSFVDPQSGSRIVYGWIPEEDITSDFAKEKGWNGSLALPRELFLLRLRNITGALRSKLEDLTCFERSRESDGSMTLLTLGVRPIKALYRLRETCARRLESPHNISLPISTSGAPHALMQASSPTWEMEAIVAVGVECESVGFYVRHDESFSRYTLIKFSILDETITVDRSHSTTDTRVDTCPDAGPFTLFATSFHDEHDGQEERVSRSKSSMEKMHIRVFSDGDVMEVFANDRFALATMVYMGIHGRKYGGISVASNGPPGSSLVERVTLWDGLRFAPEKISTPVFT